jgi:hypothetical protein
MIVRAVQFWMLDGVTGYGLAVRCRVIRFCENIRQLAGSALRMKIILFHRKYAQNIDFIAPKLNRE